MTVKVDAVLGSTMPSGVKIEQPAPKVNFKEVLEEAKGASGKPADLFQDIQQIQTSLVNGKELSGRELILLQIKTGQFGLRVELISKLAESASSTLKKFQNQQ